MSLVSKSEKKVTSLRLLLGQRDRFDDRKRMLARAEDKSSDSNAHISQQVYGNESQINAYYGYRVLYVLILIAFSAPM